MMIEEPMLEQGEVLIKHSRANIQRGLESVGGKLYLTNRRLIFLNHKINIEKGESQIPLAEISSIDLCWTKFLNRIPVFPNSLLVRTKAGEELKFVLPNRKAWKSEINRILNENSMPV